MYDFSSELSGADFILKQACAAIGMAVIGNMTK